MTTGSSTPSQTGGGAALTPFLGRILDAVARPALPEEPDATLTFLGQQSGMRIGQDYLLQLADGTRQIVTLRSVAFDAAENVTRWSILPEGLSFPIGPIDIFEAILAAFERRSYARDGDPDQN